MSRGDCGFQRVVSHICKHISFVKIRDCTGCTPTTVYHLSICWDISVCHDGGNVKHLTLIDSALAYTITRIAPPSPLIFK